MLFKLINHNVEGEFWISLDLPFDDCQDIIRVGHEQGYWKLLFEELKYYSVPLSQIKKTLEINVRNTPEYQEWILHLKCSPVYRNLERSVLPEADVEVIT